MLARPLPSASERAELLTKLTQALTAAAALAMSMGRRSRRLQATDEAGTRVINLFPILEISTLAVSELSPAHADAINSLPPSAHAQVAEGICYAVPGLRNFHLVSEDDGGEGLKVDCSAYATLPPSLPPLPPPPCKGGGGGVVNGPDGLANAGGSGDEWVDCTWQWILAFLCGLLLGLLLLCYHRRRLLEEMPDEQKNGHGFYGVHGGHGGNQVMAARTGSLVATQPPMQPPRPSPAPQPQPANNFRSPPVPVAGRMLPAGAPAARHNLTPIERARAENARNHHGVSHAAPPARGPGPGPRYAGPPGAGRIPDRALIRGASADAQRANQAAQHSQPDYEQPYTASKADPDERRVDAADGGAYTKAEFFEFYQSNVQWDRSQKAPAAGGAGGGVEQPQSYAF